MREAPFPSFTVVRVGKSLIFPRFPQFVVALLWEGWESLRSFSTLSTALFPLSCIKSGKVALSLSSDLCLQLLNIYANENTIVYDPFMGTGTTGIACEKFCKEKTMVCIGSELSDKQVEFSKNRLKELRAATPKQLSLFDE